MPNKYHPVVPLNLVEETRSALQSLRSGLIGLYEASGADPTMPQEVARRYGINRNLTWKLSRVMSAAAPIESLHHLPGQVGLEMAIGAFESAGAPREAVTRARSAVQRFSEVVQTHAGDREYLELILESMGLLEREAANGGSREMAFRGGSSVWGLQAQTRAMAAFIAPSPLGSDKLDSVVIAGLVGFQRLRASAEWVLHRQQLVDDEGESLGPTIEPLEPNSSGGPPQLLRDFCSPNMPELMVVKVPGGVEWVLPGGEVGRRAAFDCYYGYQVRGIPAYRAPRNEFGSYGAAITLPVENAVLDLVYHRSLAIEHTVEAMMYGFAQGGPDNPSAQSELNRLPMTERPVELAGSPPALYTPLTPAIGRIAERVYARMQWDPREFRGLRLLVPYAPMRSQIVLHWPLPEAPVAVGR